MYFEDNFGRQYDIPKLPQNGDYRYRKDLYCDCKDMDENKYLDWRLDGLYESNNGLFQCYTCRICGAKFYWHFPIDEDEQISEVTTLSSLHFLDRYKYIIHDYDYKVMACYPGEKTDTVQITIERNELNLSLLETHYLGVFEQPDMKEFPFRLDDFKQRIFTRDVSVDENWNIDCLNNIGTFDFTFYFLKNTTGGLSSQKYPYNRFDSADRKRWLKKFGGIKIYNDKSRVRPYGEPGNDWLRLGERQRQSPYGVGQKKGGYRIRPNQIGGSVYISNSKNLFINDQLGHEKMQENEEFNLLKSILLRIIAEFENDRNTIMYNLSQLYKSSNTKESMARNVSKTIVMERVKKDENGSQSKKNHEEVLAEERSYHENLLDKKDYELMLLRGLASVGIFVASFAHELKGLSNKLIPRASIFNEVLQLFIPQESLIGLERFDNPFYHLELIKKEDQKLQEWIKYSLSSIRPDKREWKLVSLYEYFEAFDQLWRKWLQQKSIFLIVNEVPKELIIQAFEMDLDSIFNNLVANSARSLLRTKVERKEIKVSVYRNHDFAVIDFIDNGKGLDSEYKDNPNVIFKAFETSDKDMYGNKISTGMGLYIAKSVVDSYNEASIGIIPTEVGFGIRVQFKI